MKVRTQDREPAAYFTTEKVGRTQELTPEGFLLCRDVRIARTGEMLYLPEEVGLEAGADGIVRVTRGPEDLFRPETIASFTGKAVTDDHPEEDVTPLTWNEVSVGVALNIRQGEGEQAEYLLADLLVQDAEAIAAVRDGKREVSCGYDADYEQLGPGRGRQFNIIGNHVALVDKGRCGPSCSIRDHDMRTRDARKPRTWADRIRTAFKARDEEALTEALEQAQDEMTEGTGGGETQTLVIKVEAPAAAAATSDEDETEGKKEDTQDDAEEAPAWFKSFAEKVDARLTALEGKTSDENPDADKEDGEKTDDEDPDADEGKTSDEDPDADDKDGKTQDRRGVRDSAALADEFQDMRARAEILAPGIKLPTFDAKAARKATADRMCAFRRRALEAAMADEDTAEILAPIAGKADVKKLTCDAVTTLFNAGSELVKRANSAVTSTGYVHDHATAGKPATVADINARNREFWKGKGGAL